MSEKKTIQINPELFKISSYKTRKNNKEKILLNPIVTPNNLKNKLLKRIKEHKSKEIQSSSSVNSNTKSDVYTDEFYGALNYLSDLSKKDVNQNLKSVKTLKNYNSPLNSNISLELPLELQEHNIYFPKNNETVNLNYKVEDNYPYGCLKNGKKKTYREWKKVSENNLENVTQIIRPPTPPKKTLFDTNQIKNSLENKDLSMENKYNLSRKERLEKIKNKLKKMQDNETQIKQKSLEEFNQIEKKYLQDLPEINENDETKETDINQMIKELNTKKENEKIKQYLKKTIKKKMTLGKLENSRIVSVLIKDNQTRKNIINTQKELKKTSISDIKKYLRQHGIIKAGNTCPSDILRKTFESAVLAGEVNNTNKDTLLYNFLSTSKEKD